MAEKSTKPDDEYLKIMTALEDCKSERSEWEAEWRNLSEFLLPGRGIYQTLTKPKKKQLSSPKVINSVGEESLYVLTSGMHGGLTSPAIPWFTLEWSDGKLNQIDELKIWLQLVEKDIHRGLHASNFYSTINSFYTEYAGFGTGCMYVGEDTENDFVPFRFELLTAGEYYFAIGADGQVCAFFRVLFKTPVQMVEMFPKTVPDDIKRRAGEAGGHKPTEAILEYISREKFMRKNYKRQFYVLTSSSNRAASNPQIKLPLMVDGFYEFPYPIARWSTIGSDIYGIGAGSRALNHIKRLQEMEKSFLMATHKSVNPPLQAPARMKGKLNSLPGGYTYYSNPNEVVKELYNVKFDYQGVGAAVERVEQRIKQAFYNDIFLTTARDPNATPYKAAEVTAREQEKMLRLGPVIERLQHEFLQPVIERCFNIMLRKNLLPELPYNLAKMAGDYKINLVSPLAVAQRSVALQGINSFLAFIGQAAQFDQSIMDNVDIDQGARDYGELTGVRLGGLLRTPDAVQQIRQQRLQVEQANAAKQEALQNVQIGSQVDAARATASKTQAEAGKALLESRQIASQIGMP